MGRTLRVASLGIVDYDAALGLQTELLEARIADEIEDTLLLLEHPHVFTLGRGADERFIVAKPDAVPIRRVSRGGQVTYHGPGQLVGYPILKLDGRARDVSKYLRSLEQAMIEALANFGIEANRREGLTGVWVGARKIGSIGVGIRRWVTYHGFALNVSTDLSFFDSIVPCGIEGCEMTSMAALKNREVSIDEFRIAMRDSFQRVFGYGSMIEMKEGNGRRDPKPHEVSGFPWR
ncbi:MAG: lipoyl(octanoyl) transferase LipB [Candidatus Binatus sp.]|uniref:lipoyl(octanoyl) transferase LipB n=1 Tax=Candidatus Binatus sp. TaxID=2811406 RepID=UPI00271EA067|nr:lipoyl(octanoyl) transferase LipB [Candidatus Binatus sp.]MDO8434559.1 lipoyl(octanoyl) transferase LipB [Candidatus Binatus sp.]